LVVIEGMEGSKEEDGLWVEGRGKSLLVVNCDVTIGGVIEN
jgi:hypothetical protein